jgi:AcrR family transcriptional regulator
LYWGLKVQQQRAIDKHTCLVEAGAKVIHERGFQRTLLADIAKDADVPQGSIYYYFKTKEDLATAILSTRMTSLHTLIRRWGELPNPKKRLNALIQVWVDDKDVDSRYGCPIGSLCYELAKDRGKLSEMAAEPLRLLVEWCEVQFRELNKSARQASDLATHLICALQGVSLLANAFGDAQLILREANQLKLWIKEL